MDITINGNINFNGNFEGNRNQGICQNEGTFHDLLDNEITFNELLDFLRKRAQRKNGMVGETADGDQDVLVKAKRSPGSVQLRNSCAMVARIAVGEATCEVYENGYAIFDNGDRRTVVWVPDCTKAVRYYYPPTYVEKCEEERRRRGEDEDFDPADAKIIEGTELKEDRLTEEQLANMAWYFPVVIAGENRIEWNLEHPMSAGNRSDRYEDEIDSVGRYNWSCGARFENPEDAVIRKEEQAERCADLTEKQREAYELYFMDGFTQAQIADMLGTSQRAICDRLEAARKKIAEYYERNF